MRDLRREPSRTQRRPTTRNPVFAGVLAYAWPEHAAGLTPFELARVVGTSVRTIDRQCGALVEGGDAAIANRQDTLVAGLEQASASGELG
jgi:hypothetical protein